MFDYVETYTFQRGEAFEADKQLKQVAYNELKVKKNNNQTLSTEEEEKFLTLDGLLDYTQYLINDSGAFHPSSKKTHTFLKGDLHVSRIISILQTPINDIPRWLCSPYYRDALVFYNADRQIVSALNICLSCQYMETSMFNHINGDYKTYALLKRFFIEIGHEVEEPVTTSASL